MIICNTYHFGDVHRFGITFELPKDPEMYSRSWLRGSAWYWIFGQCIGDMQYVVPLCDAMLELGYINKRKSFSCCKEIFFADAKHLLRVMDEDIGNDADGIVKENCFGFVGSYDFWLGFEITMQLDIMEEYQIFLFEYDGQARLIIAKLKKNKDSWKFQSEHKLNAGEVQAIICEAFEWLQLRYQQELDNERSTTSIENRRDA